MLLAPPAVTIDTLNEDSVLHNFHTHSNMNPSMNVAHPTFVSTVSVSFSYPEKIQVGCDIHPWMNTWIIVMDHPYYILTDEDGVFELNNVPAGTYEIRVWQETLGAETKIVTVKERKEVEVDFKL